MEKKVIMAFPPESTYKSLTYDLVKLFDIKINIIKAQIEIGKGGKLLAVFEADDANLERGIEYVKSNGVTVSSLSNSVFYDSTRCTDCGACVSACPSGALTIAAPDWHLCFDPDKCILCRLCLTSCPQRLFSIEFSE